MDRRDMNLGDEIKNIIQDAVSTMNFQQINKDISRTVNSALDEVRRATKEIRLDKYTYKRQTHYVKPPHTEVRKDANADNVANVQLNKKRQVPTVVDMQVGSVAGVLYTVFGSIGVGLFGVAIVVLGIVGGMIGLELLFGNIIALLLPFLGISFIMSIRGGVLRSRTKRLKRYVEILNGRSCCMIKELADRTGLKKKYVLRDLRKMLRLGIFREGYIDPEETTLMVNKEAYQQYLISQEIKHLNLLNKEKEIKEREEQVKREEEDKKARQLSKESTVLNSELDKALADGKMYVREIQLANEAILDEEVSKKLDRMEQVSIRIFHFIESHPEQLKEIRKFMEYYLPTTLKLLNAYKEFDKQPIQGENITSSKNEIKSTLDTINLAFEKLLDDLFEDTAMDVSTDITVLETMLAQEGLSEKDFMKNKE